VWQNTTIITIEWCPGIGGGGGITWRDGGWHGGWHGWLGGAARIMNGMVMMVSLDNVVEEIEGLFTYKV
jgi:hypothetical protein